MNQTLHYLFLGYLILYALFGAALFVLYAKAVPKEEKKFEPSWETPLDIALVVVGFAGMLFLFLEIHSRPLQLAWRPISVVLLVTQVWLNLRARLLNPIAQDKKSTVVLVDVATWLFLAPSLVLNLVYAFR